MALAVMLLIKCSENNRQSLASSKLTCRRTQIKGPPKVIVFKGHLGLFREQMAEFFEIFSFIGDWYLAF